jgi:site-specific DNA-methyltransferase (adenine-specific)
MTEWISNCGKMTLRLGDWREVLADVDACDAVITDPPYGARTHDGQRHGRKDARYCDPSKHPLLSARGLGYDPLSVEDVLGFVQSWSDRSGWICALTSHDLVCAFADVGKDRYSFAPIACVQHAMNVRLAGDGPSNWTTWLMVSRPRTMRNWGALPGAYVGKSHDIGENALDRSKRPVAGGKPLWLMRAIVKDYSRPGDLIVDPFAGGGTTLLAAAIEGRTAIGAELDPKTFALAVKRLSAGYTPMMF